MKKLLAMTLGCLIVLLSSSAFAACSSCNRCVACEPTYSECECTDPNKDRNTCMSTQKYCQVFGNPGGLSYDTQPSGYSCNS